MYKSEIVTRLIKAGHITIEEAVVLMEKETVYIPQQPLTPWYPTPYWYTTGDLTAKTTNETGQSLTITSTCTKN